MSSLIKDVWITELMKQPIPDTSFVSAGRNLDAFVDNGIVKLIEAGSIPESHVDYDFKDDLPVQAIEDIPHEYPVKVISTNRTKHQNLREVELVYDKRASIVETHKQSLLLAMCVMAAYGWSPRKEGSKNKVVVATDKDSIIDHIIDMKAWYDGQDLSGERNVVLTASHLARIAKEDAKLYKELGVDKGGNIFGFKVWSYSAAPCWNIETKERLTQGAIPGEKDKQGSFFFIGNEVFRCFGQAKMFENTSAGQQGDLISFGVRAAADVLRVKDPKYLAVIV